LQQANWIIGPAYFVVYIFFIFFILLNMFLAIINDAYSEVKAEMSRQKHEFEMIDFFKKVLLSFYYVYYNSVTYFWEIVFILPYVLLAAQLFHCCMHWTLTAQHYPQLQKSIACSFGFSFI